MRIFKIWSLIALLKDAIFVQMEKFGGMQRKNINRGYQGLFVWQDAKELYKLTCEIVKVFSFDYKKVVANQIGG